MCVIKMQAGTGQYFEWMERDLSLRRKILESTSYLLPFASETRLDELYSKPLRAPTLICSPCCVI